jgi:hypothetical protein
VAANQSDSAEGFGPTPVPESSGQGVTPVGVLVFIAVLGVVAALVSVAVGTVLLGAVGVIAGWFKLPALHLLVASVGVMLVIAVLGAAILIGADLREVRHALHGVSDHPYGSLGRLLDMGMAGAIDAEVTPPRPRRRAKKKPTT